ncbi:MAG: glucokinase [Neptuniibacter sp.]
MNSYALVCDIGGTNARFALVPEGTTQLVKEQTLKCADYSNVYLCGENLPRISEFLLNSEFRQVFENKECFSSYLTQVPAHLWMASNPGLVGAAAALNNENVKG